MAQTCPICRSEIPDDAAACAKCGFKVLGQTQSFKPVKIDASETTPDRKAVQNRELHVIRGPQTGMQISLRDGELTIGRDPRCDIFLNDMTVSRDHAVLQVRDTGCLLTDRNSFNGVWVNDRMVETYLLQPGDLIQIGAFCLVYKER